MRLVATVLALLAASSLHAADWLVAENHGRPGEVRSSWTAERFLRAQPIRVSLPSLDAQPSRTEERAADEAPVRLSGAKRPSVDIGNELRTKLFDPASPKTERSEKARQPAPALMFTSSRLVPSSADQSYPYSAVGKLFFTVPGIGEAQCTASLISPRLLLTAGHCVSDGSGTFYEDFVFVPAYHSGSTPLGVWEWSSLLVTSTWATGRGRQPNAADYALIELEDRTVSGSPRRIGEITGWLCALTKKLVPNLVTSLGYPGNIDGGQLLHQVTSQSLGAGPSNTGRYPSDMEFGSSGGPWIQKLGIPGEGQDAGDMNCVVGVTSSGIPGSRIAMASILDQRLTQMFQSLCARQEGNC